jgi:alpha-ribazole phosphatase/probable phosphoglycerate mutase
MTRLLLIRHGETDWNQEGRWQGQADVPLNEAGRRQAERISELLEDCPIEAVYSSDLQRARETALILASEKDLPLVMDERLREIHQGEWQGLRVSEIEASYGRLFEERNSNLLNVAPPGGETAFQVQSRMLEAVCDILRRHSGKTVAIVSHGFALAVVRAHYLDLPADRIWEQVPKNGEIIVMDLESC